MKQYLHSSGPTIIVSLQNIAYAAVSTCIDGRAQGELQDNVIILKLLLPRISNDDKTTENCHNDTNKETLTQVIVEQQRSNAIQAVASYWEPKRKLLFYAVSLYDKSLAIYSVSIEKLKENTKDSCDENMVEINPEVIHKAAKRCCSLSFASIASEDDNKLPSVVIVAGDLNGDATAYCTEPIRSGKSHSRLLLGHTASMLTSIEVVGDNKSSSKILTSDRDEKVRVSSFPNCFHVEGYLLGHSSYVSDVKIIPNAEYGSTCLTCSGDKTLKLFDYETMQEISTVSIPVNRNENDESSSIPVRLAVSTSGKLVAVMYDSFRCIELFSITIDGNNTSIELVQSIECSTLPLGISFQDEKLNILTQEPKLVRFAKGVDSLYHPINDNISMSLGSKLNSSNVMMPMSILEVDVNTGKIKLEKQENKGKVGFVKNEPWMKRERIEVYKKGLQRRKQRKLEKDKPLS